LTSDERYLATVDESVARVWRLDESVEIARFPANEQTRDVAFAADGSQLYLVSGSGVKAFSLLEGQALITEVCARLGAPLTPEEWTAALPDVPYEPACR